MAYQMVCPFLWEIKIPKQINCLGADGGCSDQVLGGGVIQSRDNSGWLIQLNCLLVPSLGDVTLISSHSLP